MSVFGGMVVALALFRARATNTGIGLTTIVAAAFPVASIGIGRWTWRTNRGARYLSAWVIAMGAVAIALSLTIFVIATIISRSA